MGIGEPTPADEDAVEAVARYLWQMFGVPGTNWGMLSEAIRAQLRTLAAEALELAARARYDT